MIEAEILVLKGKMQSNREDLSMWKRGAVFKNEFSTRETWLMLREAKPLCSWAKGVWFPQATPKYAFITWLAMLDRLSTMDRVHKWNPSVDMTCVLCKRAAETRDHLFFTCHYSAQVWQYLTKGILCDQYTEVWREIVGLLTVGNREKKSLFCLSYSFQASVHAVWKERNKIRHGDKALPMEVLKKLVDKGIRNRLSLLRTAKVKGKEDSFQV